MQRNSSPYRTNSCVSCLSSSSLTFADIALAWLRHPPRVGRLLKSPTGRAANPIVAGFVDDIALHAPSRTIDEVEHLVFDFLARYADLPSWWDALLQENRIDFVFDSGEPRIDADDIGPWRRITSAVDPDTLVALVFAQRYMRVCRPKDLRRWGTVVGTQNPDVRRLFLDGRVRVHDTHVHLEGCEPMPLLWEGVVSGRLRPSSFEHYRMPAGASGLAAEIAAEMESIGRATLSFRHLVRATPSDTDVGGLDAGMNASRLWLERRVLTAAWVSTIGIQGEVGNDTNGARLARALDVYTFGKSSFMSRLVQGPGRNPGLATFRRYFRRGKVLPKSTKGFRNPRPAPEPSRRQIWERWCRMGRHATENRGLAAVELRIAPMGRVADYVRFFDDFDRQKDFVAHRGTKVSFVVHFIRQDPSSPHLSAHRDRERRLGFGLHLEAAAVEDDEARRAIDRQSAILHRFRVSRPEKADRIVGIDVANVERRNPVHLFSPYLRLLRLRSSDDLPVGPARHFRRWREIVAENLHVMPTGTPPLGLTFHVGEDFFHPLEGIKAIWEYMMFCGVCSGDRIGHGLALGIDIPSFNATRGRSAIMPTGAALDLLAWIRHRLAVLPNVSAIGLRKIEDDIRNFSQRVHGRAVGAADLYQLVRARHGLRRDAGEGLPPTARILLDREAADSGYSRAAKVYAPLPESLLREDLEESFGQIQDNIVEEVVQRELFIETNPSSNVNILGLQSVREHPIFRLLHRHPGLQLTVNTDDPGTFATSLELEYALARDALKHQGFTRVDRLLEDFGRCSERAAFSTPPNRRIHRAVDAEER